MESADRSSRAPERYFNTFDYSVNYSEEMARSEIEKRLAEFAWTKQQSEFAERMTRESLKQMIAGTEEIAFGDPDRGRTSLQRAKGWVDRQRVHIERFPPFNRFPRAADRTYAARAVLQKLKRIDPSKPFFSDAQSDKTFEAAVSYGWLMSYESDQNYPDFVEPRFVRNGFHVYKFKEVNPDLRFHPFLTTRTTDLLDLLVLALGGHFPIWISHSNMEWYDGGTKLSREIAKHDMDHTDDQLLGLAYLRKRFSFLTSEEVLRFEQEIGIELLITALSQPTAIRRVIAVAGLFGMKHERGTVLSRLPHSMYFQDQDQKGMSVFDLKYVQALGRAFGEFRGLGWLILTEANQADIDAVVSDLIATHTRVAPRFLH